MHYVPIDNVNVGMTTVKNIYDNRGILLLSSNKKLSHDNINKIKQLGYQGLYIYDNLSKYEDFKEIINEETRINSINSLKSLDLDLITYYANEIVNSLTSENFLCVELRELSNFHDYTYQHCVNVAILATTIGIGLGFTNSQLENLSLAALLHDIGKCDIPSSILDKPGKLTDEEFEIIKTHSMLSYEKIRNNTNISATIKASVLEHHENEDGSGYPRHLKSNEIHIFAKIIHVVDVYDALISKRSYKKAHEPAEAIEYLMSNVGKMFDLSIVLTFIKYIALYPVGTRITLSNGKEAQIVKNNPNMPLRPVVALLDTEEIIDLYLNTDLYNLTIKESEKIKLDNLQKCN